MLMPKKVKFRKQQRGRMRGKAWKGHTVAFGDYGLKTLEAGWLTDRQIEAGTCRNYPLHQTEWSSLDPDFSGQAGHQEAARNPHG